MFAAIGSSYGNGDGFNTFNLPDVRGEFIRAWDDGRGVDVSRTLGSYQSDEIKSHVHSVTAQAYSDAGSGYLVGGPNNGNDGTVSTTSTGGTETRPRNIALLACIKY